MKKRAIVWIFSAFWLLGPVEPVFALEGDIAGQFPDVMTGQGSEPIAPATAQQPGPEWNVGHRRQRRRYFDDFDGDPRSFRRPNRHDAKNFGAPDAPSVGSVAQPNDRTFNYSDEPMALQHPAAGNADPVFPPQFSGRPFHPYFAPPVSQGQSFMPMGMTFAAKPRVPGERLINGFDLNAPRHADKFADKPPLDENGVRRFKNGRHHDLSTMQMTQALADAEADDDRITQQHDMAIAMRRQKAMQKASQFSQFAKMFGY